MTGAGGWGTPKGPWGGEGAFGVGGAHAAR